MKVLFCIHCENNFKNFFGHTFEVELAKLVYGGGDSECLQCWRDILEYLDLDYTETGVIF